MTFPEKAYDRLNNLWRQWGLSQEDVYYAIENGLLRVCVWLPLRYVERGTIRDQKFIHEQHEHKEGFIGVRPQDFHLICSNGSAKLRTFRSVKADGHVLRLAYEPPQPSLCVRIHDLVVLKADREAFEIAHAISPQQMANYPDVCPSLKEFSASADYRHIMLDGLAYQLGDVQASVVQQLHDAAASKNMWMHGKTLLVGANSKAVRLRDIFKSKNDWQKIIVSDGRGYYRLNLPEIKPRVSTVQSKAA